jgi:hypothetical protein
VARVGGRLNALRHEQVLRRQLLCNAFLLLGVRNVVPYGIQINEHFGLKGWRTSPWSCHLLIDQHLGVGMLEGSKAVARPNGASLLHVESDAFAVKSTPRIVDKDLRFGDLLRSVHVLFVACPHFRHALVDAAPSLDDALLSLLLVGLEWQWGLTDGQNLFVFHVEFVIDHVEGSLDDVLYLCLGLLTGVLVFEVDGARHADGELNAEGDLVLARVQDPVGNLEDWLLEVSELMVALDALVLLNLLVTLLHKEVPGKSCLLDAFEFNLDILGLGLSEDLDEDLPLDHIAWLVVWEFGLHHDAALLKVATGITKIHKFL